MTQEDTSSISRPGRHRRRRRVKPLLLGLAGAVAAGGVTGGALMDTTASVGKPEANGCAHVSRPLRVDAAPEVASAIAAVARSLHHGRCGTSIHVRSADPYDVATALDAGRRTALPDVWIPDSSLWEAQVTKRRLAGPSIAWSPVVLALPAAAARSLGTAPGFRQVAEAATTSHPLVLGTADPSESATSATALVSLANAFPQDPTELAALASLLRTTGAARAGDAPTLPAQPPAVSGDPVALASTEQAVWTANRRTATANYVAVYPPAPAPVLDYPYLVLSGSADAERVAAALLARLRGGSGQSVLARSGFRAPSGRPAAPAVTVAGVSPDVAAADRRLTRAQVAGAAAEVALVNKPSRLLAVIDVSGSMAAAVPGDPGATRISLARAAAEGGLKLLPSDTVAGLWRFSADLTATTDYQQLVGLAPMTDATRSRLAAAARGLDYVPGGGTGLYDSVLAAVRTVRQTYDPSRVNSVVLLTDGKDEADFDHRIALRTLLAALDAERRSSQPVKVISIAYGPDSDAHALRLISAASGGAFYDSTDPRALATIFRNAIGRRLCRQSC